MPMSVETTRRCPSVSSAASHTSAHNNTTSVLSSAHRVVQIHVFSSHEVDSSDVINCR